MAVRCPVAWLTRLSTATHSGAANENRSTPWAEASASYPSPSLSSESCRKAKTPSSRMPSAGPSARLVMPHPTRTAFIVSRNGVVIGAAMASPDYLGWAHTPDREPEELERVLVNQVPLIEFTTEVIRFAYECVGAELGKERWTLRAVGRRLLSPVPVNLDLRLSTGPFPPLPNPATREEFRVELRGSGDVFRDARALLIEVDGEGFGLGEDTLPFVRDNAIDLTLVGS